MKTLLIGLSLFAGQMITYQGKPVAHLPANQKLISTGFGGQVLQLINAPSVIYLPIVVPRLDALGAPWLVDVKNFGPGIVTVSDKGQFSVPIKVGETVSISANGTVYSSPSMVRH